MRLPIHDKIIKLLTDNGIKWEDNKDLARGIMELVMGNQKESLKQEIFNHSSMKEGKNCPICNQRVKMMKKNIDASMVHYLIKLYRLTQKYPLQSWFHVSNDIGVSYEVGGRFAKLRFWGLIEEKKKDFSDDKRTSGMWRITENGNLFVEGKLKVQKYVKLYNMGFYGLEGEDVDVHEALKEKFSYKQLMSL